jgi:hypothetical protein
MGCLALLLVLLAQSGAEERAFVELVGPRAACYVEQPLRVTIRFGVEREYLRHNVLQLFTRSLDVPVQLELPSGVEFEPPGPVETDALAAQPSFALGEEIVRAARSAEEMRAGSSWVVLEIERELVPHAAGRLEISGPVLHFARATRFEEDQVSGSVPLDRSMALVRGAPLLLEIAPPPVEGRPAAFVDAVGRFTLHAEAEPRELAIGERLKLVLTLEGRGNLARLTLPRLDDLPGLHLLGRTEELSGIARKVSCDFVLDSARAREIPAIALEYFDPEARVYRRASSEPIPLRVRASAPAGPIGFRALPGLYVLLGVAALILLAWFLRTRRSGNKV